MSVEPIKNGVKTQTRRKFNEKTYKMWVNAFRRSTINKAYNKNPRNGGKHIADFILKGLPEMQRIHNMTHADLVAECVPCKTPEEFAKLTGFEINELVMVLFIEIKPITQLTN